MSQAPDVSFERTVRQFAEWHAVPEHERSEAPSWWWGPAFEARGLSQTMPDDWSSSLGLPAGSIIAAGAATILASFAGQTSLPWVGDFPRRMKYADPA